MGSLKFQISRMQIDEQKQYRQQQHNKDGDALEAAEISTRTAKIYKNAAVKFGEFCKEKHGCKTPEDCAPYVQEYADWLAAQGKSPNTVHTYAAGICRYWGVPLETIKKPRRSTPEITKSRGHKAVDERRDAQRDTSPRLYDFAQRVGLRRSEYQRLQGNDFVYDESGAPCVRILRGKGGKYQEQRILPEDLEFVKSYFDGSEAYVFSQGEMKNKLDLHHLRAVHAQRMYAYYAERIKDDTYRAQLVSELQARWTAHNNKKHWNPAVIEGTYYLRAANRSFAKEHGLPTRYNRLAVMAVSVFALSHWRCDVSVNNYLLAI